MAHNPPKFLREGKNSTAWYCTTDPESLIVFVHGFKGLAVETWNDFPYFIKNRPAFANSDILFYGYDSLDGQAHDQAMDLLKFLQKYSTPPTSFREQQPTPYKKIILVAHSLGAVVARFALLGAIKQQKPWRNQCKLVLFAPAHNGARVQRLMMLSLPGFYKVIGGLFMFKKPILDDLDPASQALKKLASDTLKYQQTAEEALLTALVMEAYGDKIVHNGLFCFDQYHADSPIKRKSHTDVCKPIQKKQYLLPVHTIESLL